jgi:hypothetical protein
LTQNCVFFLFQIILDTKLCPFFCVFFFGHKKKDTKFLAVKREARSLLSVPTPTRPTGLYPLKTVETTTRITPKTPATTKRSYGT